MMSHLNVDVHLMRLIDESDLAFPAAVRSKMTTSRVFHSADDAQPCFRFLQLLQASFALMIIPGQNQRAPASFPTLALSTIWLMLLLTVTKGPVTRAGYRKRDSFPAISRPTLTMVQLLGRTATARGKVGRERCWYILQCTRRVQARSTALRCAALEVLQDADWMQRLTEGRRLPYRVNPQFFDTK